MSEPDIVKFYGFDHVHRGSVGWVDLFQDTDYRSEWNLTFRGLDVEEAMTENCIVTLRVNNQSVSGYTVDHFEDVAAAVDDLRDRITDDGHHEGALTPAQMCDLYSIIDRYTPKGDT